MVALGEEAVQSVADAGDDKYEKRRLHAPGDEQPEYDRDKHGAANGDQIWRIHVTSEATSSCFLNHDCGVWNHAG